MKRVLSIVIIVAIFLWWGIEGTADVKAQGGNDLLGLLKAEHVKSISLKEFSGGPCEITLKTSNDFDDKIATDAGFKANYAFLEVLKGEAKVFQRYDDGPCPPTPPGVVVEKETETDHSVRWTLELQLPQWNPGLVVAIAAIVVLILIGALIFR